MSGRDESAVRGRDAPPETSFHAASFAAGLLLGAGLVAVARKNTVLLGGVVGTARQEAQRAEEQSAAALRQLSDIQSSLRRLERTVPESESRLGSRLQAQERHIAEGMTSHYAELGKSLSTVQSYGRSLLRTASQIDDLKSIFHSPRTRGAVGEMHLEELVRDAFPPGMREFQSRTLSNGSRPDCILRLPPPIGDLVIDAKFPLDAFREMQRGSGGGGESSNVSPNGGPTSVAALDAATARKKLSGHLRDHVKTIATKYVIPGETASSAILFLPSEVIFAEVVEHHQQVVIEAFRLNVLIASPTTLMAMLTTMRGMVRDVTVSRRATEILSEVQSMEADIERLKKRSEDVERNFDRARESLRQMNISAEKISRRRQSMTLLSEETDEESAGRST